MADGGDQAVALEWVCLAAPATWRTAPGVCGSSRRQSGTGVEPFRGEGFVEPVLSFACADALS
jgi:hypothetical protein